MPRRLRIEFEGAIDHVMARGSAPQKIVRDDADRQRSIGGREHAVIRYGWELSSYVDVEPALLAKRHDPNRARPVAAWLCRRHTEATLGELAEWLGLSQADSVPNLTPRFQAQLKSQPELLNDV